MTPEQHEQMREKTKRGLVADPDYTLGRLTFILTDLNDFPPLTPEQRLQWAQEVLREHREARREALEIDEEER